MKAKEYMDKGLLVPDDLTVAMVKDRLNRTTAKKAICLTDFQEPFLRRKHWIRC
jgi:adenylate kinase